MRNRIRELRDKKRLSLQKLADLVGTSRQQIHKLEKGEIQLTTNWMQRIAPHLDVGPKDLIEDDLSMPPTSPLKKDEPREKESLTFRDTPMPKMERTLPVLGRVKASSEGTFHMPNEQLPVDWTFRPPQLEGVKEAYGVFVYNDCMAPKYEEGQTLWVHPDAPCKPGDGIVLIKHNDEAMVKILVRRTQQMVRVKQLNPPEEFDVPQAEIRAIHRVLGALDPI
jgi:phage repressor protein C with HTH and peptisase S24 domain